MVDLDRLLALKCTYCEPKLRKEYDATYNDSRYAVSAEATAPTTQAVTPFVERASS
jgi:hypothetical protein